MVPIAQNHSPCWAWPCSAGPMQPRCTWEHLLTPHWPSTFTAAQQLNAVLLAGKFTDQHVCPAGSLLMETPRFERDSSIKHNHRKVWDSFSVQVLGKKELLSIWSGGEASSYQPDFGFRAALCPVLSCIPAPAWVLWPNVLPVIMCLIYTTVFLHIYFEIFNDVWLKRSDIFLVECKGKLTHTRRHLICIGN